MRFLAGQPEIPLVPARGGTLIEPEVTVSILLDAAFGSTIGNILQRTSAGWVAAPGGAGTGTVTSVAGSGLLTGTVTTTGNISIANNTANTLLGFGSGGAPSVVTVAGAATLSAGVLTVTSATPGGTSGQFQVNSSGSLAGVTFSGDFTVTSAGLGTVTKTNGVPFAASATIDTTVASNISSGTVAVPRLPVMVASGTAHAAGIVGDPGPVAGSTRYWREDASWATPPTGSGTVNSGTINQIAVYASSGTAVSGVNSSTLSFASSQITGLAASATTDTTNASNITSGTLPAARLPNPSSSTLGGIESAAAVTSNWINSISTSGVPSLSQPAFTDISGTAAASQLPVVGLTITQHVGTIISITESAGTATVNWALGDSHTVTLNANCTIAFGSPAVGQSVLLRIVQASSGGPYTISAWPSGITWVAGTGPPVASTNAGNALWVKIYCISSGVYDGWNLGIENEPPVAGAVTEISETSSFTATSGQFYIISGSSAVTATLPTAVGISGQTIRVRCVNGYTGLCTIATTSSQTISGASTRIIFAGESPLLMSDGSNWVRVGGTVVACNCLIYLGTNQTITSGSDTVANLNTISFDNTGQLAVTASHEIKIFRPGQYTAIGSGYWGSFTSASHRVYTNVAQNGSGPILQASVIAADPLGGGSEPMCLNCTGGMTCAAGDLITLHVYQANAGTTSETLTAASGNTYLQVTEVLSW